MKEYSMKNYLREGRLIDKSNNPTILFNYMGIIGRLKGLECILKERYMGDTEPYNLAIQEIAENGTDRQKAAIRMMDHINALHRATERGLHFVEEAYFDSDVAKEDKKSLHEQFALAGKEMEEKSEEYEVLRDAAFKKRKDNIASVYSARVEADSRIEEEYEKAGYTAFANNMRDSAEKYMEDAKAVEKIMEAGVKEANIESLIRYIEYIKDLT